MVYYEIYKNNKILIIVIAIIILVIVGLIVLLIPKKGEDEWGNSYNFSDDVVELPDTVTYNNEKLTSRHCLNSICVEEVTFYYSNDTGRVEYTITNTSNKTKSGYLKMVFKNEFLIIAYKDLVPKRTIKSRTQYTGKEIKDKSDYKLKKLTKEEISKIKK